MSALPEYFRRQLVPLLPGRHRPRCRDTDRAFDLGMPKQELDGPEISCPPIDQGSFGAAQRVRPEQSRVQSHAADPLGDEAGVLAGGHTTVGAAMAGEQELAGPFASNL